MFFGNDPTKLTDQEQFLKAISELGYANFYETERANKAREGFAGASQTDINGNKIWFNPATKSWEIDLSPLGKQLNDAENAERFASLTEDAPRNRDIARRRDVRSKAAEEEFGRAFNSFKFRPQKSEADYIGQAIADRSLASSAGGSKAGAIAQRQLLRTGNGSRIPEVFRDMRDAETEEFANVLAGGRRQGMQDFLQFEGAKDNRAQGELDFLRGIADDTIASPLRFGNENAALTGGRDNAMNSFMRSFDISEQSRQGANQQLIAMLREFMQTVGPDGTKYNWST